MLLAKAFRHSETKVISPKTTAEPLVEVPHGPKSRLRKIAKLATRALAISAGVLSLGGIGIYSGAKLKWRNFEKEASSLKHEDNGLAILISYRTSASWDKALSPIGKDFIPEYVSRTELAFGQKADVVKKGATIQDLLDALMDDKIQNIVVFGHGSWDSWGATDGYIDSFTLSTDLRNKLREKGYLEFHKKSGIFVQHTCGVGKMFEGSTFPIDRVMKDVSLPEDELNLALQDHSMSGKYETSVSFDAKSYKAIEEGWALGYTIEFKVKSDKEYAVGAINYTNGMRNGIFDGKITYLELESVHFDYYYPLGSHPFHHGFIYPRDKLEAIADFINLVHETVEKNTATTQKTKRTLGYPLFSNDRIIVVEGINYPWQWMRQPFGPDGTNLDRYKK